MKSKIACFVYGMLGLLTSLLIYLVVLPIYSDYRAVVETEALVFKMDGLQRSVEDVFQKNGRLDFDPASADEMELDGQTVIVLRNGVLIARGGTDGQLVVQVPQVEEGKLRWRCFVGPERLTPTNCLP